MGNKNFHSLSPGLVEIFRRVGLAVKSKGENRVHMQKDLSLNNTEFGNYQKLRYFGLIAKYKIRGRHLKGHWLITRLGGQFLRHETAIPIRVPSQDNKVVTEEKSEKERFISFYYKPYGEEYWQREFESIDTNQPALF